MTVRRLLVLATVSVFWPAGARGAPLDQSRAEAALGVAGLVGVWSCAGAYAGKSVTATMRWYHLEDGTLWNTLHPTNPDPSGPAHATIIEQWRWDAEPDASRWLTEPDRSSSDQAAFSSPGRTGRTMTWLRQAAQSTMARTFAFPAADKLRFEEHHGGNGTPKVVDYALACKRTLRHEPPPG